MIKLIFALFISIGFTNSALGSVGQSLVGPLAPAPYSAAQTHSVYDLMPGCSLGIALPHSGAPWGGNAAAGLRCLTEYSLAVGLYGQYGKDKANHSENYGGFLRIQYFFESTARALPYLFVQGMYGENKVESSATTQSFSEAVAGGAFGGGVEVFIIPEISVAADAGVGSRFAPTKQSLTSTFTSQISVYFHF